MTTIEMATDCFEATTRDMSSGFVRGIPMYPTTGEAVSFFFKVYAPEVTAAKVVSWDLGYARIEIDGTLPTGFSADWPSFRLISP